MQVASSHGKTMHMDKNRKTEKQKLAAGKLYKVELDPTLQQDLLRAKQLCFEFNQVAPRDIQQRLALLDALIGRLGKEPVIEQPFYCDYGYNIEIGHYFYSNVNLVILDCAKVRFGDHVFIGPNCGFYTAGHPLDKERRSAGLEFAKPITVGSNVWFGAQVAVLPGVTIGDDSVIGAGSVVSRDIPAGVLALGNPCKVVRGITEADKEKFSR